MTQWAKFLKILIGLFCTFFVDLFDVRVSCLVWDIAKNFGKVDRVSDYKKMA